MANDWFPKPDGDAVGKANQVVGAIEATPASYGLAATDATRLRGKVAAFNTALIAVDTANAALATAVANKNNARLALEDDLRPTVRIIQERPATTDQARVTAGIPVRDTTRTFTAPVAPVNLVANASADGRNSLKWNSTANAPGVLHVVEVKRGAAPDFVLLDVVSASSYADPNGVPGQHTEYRVKARRSDVTSAPSNVAAVH
jgi:hypothetical protein